MLEPSSFVGLKTWIVDNGGAFNPDALYKQDPSGSCIVAGRKLPPNSTVVSCPFDLVITQPVAKTGILDVLGGSIEGMSNEWSERQWISTYLSLHWIIDPNDSRFGARDQLLHRKYLNTLPRADALRTPLHFTSAELHLFKGTNLYGATLDREREWKTEWTQCQNAVSLSNAYLGEQFTWERYLTAATYLSSRAFPSSLLSPTPTLVHSPTTQPILIPGVDALNHARGKSVSWSVTYPDDDHMGLVTSAATQRPTISLVIHTPADQGDELFNNYGPKPNSELILGYGFSMPNNPDDTMVLKIGGVSGNKWEVGRNAQGVEGLWKEILLTICESEQEPTYEDILDASGMLGEMVEALIQRLPNLESKDMEGLRPDVVSMFSHYLEGQKSILFSLLEFSREREQDAIKMAQDEGIDIVLEDD